VLSALSPSDSSIRLAAPSGTTTVRLATSSSRGSSRGKLAPSGWTAQANSTSPPPTEMSDLTGSRQLTPTSVSNASPEATSRTWTTPGRSSQATNRKARMTARQTATVPGRRKVMGMSGETFRTRRSCAQDRAPTGPGPIGPPGACSAANPCAFGSCRGSGLSKETAFAQRTLDHRAPLSCALVRLRLVRNRSCGERNAT
jgi:hypothetical protein